MDQREAKPIPRPASTAVVMPSVESNSIPKWRCFTLTPRFCRANAMQGSLVTTSNSPSSTSLSGHDLLRAVGLAVEGPVLWGHPLAASGPGVFIVELPAAQPKVSIDPAAIREWLDRSPQLRLDGQRPTVAELQSRLASFWLPSQVILYVGSSKKSVSARLLGMSKTPLGERRPQPAGYWLKTLRDLPKPRI